MKILLSPSKTMSHKQVPKWAPAATTPLFLNEAEQLMKRLNSVADQLESELHISKKIADANRKRFAQWDANEHTSLGWPAFWLYSGDVFNGVAVEQFDQEAINWAIQHVLVVSGLYGLVRPTDLLMPYRLEMKSQLAGKWGRDLYAFWGSKLASTIDDELIFNCASQESFKAVVPFLKPNQRVIAPVFYIRSRAGTIEQKALFSKYMRGVYARWMCLNKITDTNRLPEFCEEGFVYNAALSSKNAPCYVAPGTFTLMGRFKKPTNVV
jgi:uncharacterized protein